MDKQTRSAEILEKMKAAFEMWQTKKITDEELKSIYQDIEKILREAKQ